jgi:hypothetical protein
LACRLLGSSRSTAWKSCSASGPRYRCTRAVPRRSSALALSAGARSKDRAALQSSSACSNLDEPACRPQCPQV